MFERVHFDHREIEFLGYAHDTRGNDSGAGRKRCLQRTFRAGIGQNHLDALRPVYHVGVGYNVTALFDHEAGADRPLRADNRGGIASVSFLERPIAGYEDLHHARRHFLDERVHGLV